MRFASPNLEGLTVFLQQICLSALFGYYCYITVSVRLKLTPYVMFEVESLSSDPGVVGD